MQKKMLMDNSMKSLFCHVGLTILLTTSFLKKSHAETDLTSDHRIVELTQVHSLKSEFPLKVSEVTVEVNESLCQDNISQSISDEGVLSVSLTDNSTLGCPGDDDKLPHAPQIESSTLVRVGILTIIALISLIGNAATLISICRTRRQSRSTVYLMIAQLAVADLMVTFFCVLAEAIWTFTVQWLAGDIMCKLVKYMQMFSLYLSTFILVIIGFDRFSAVRFPMKRTNVKKSLRRLVFGVYVLSGVLSLPQLAIFSVQRGPFIEDFYQCVTYGFYTAAWQEQLYTTISLILMFLLPLVILITTYICTFYTIAKKEDGLSDRTRTVMDDARRKIIHKAKIKSLMITVVIVLTFVVCWTPYYCMMIIFIFLEPDDQLSDDLQAAIFFFGSSTALINPLIYGAFHLRRRPSRSKTINHSSASTRVENSVMLVTFRKSRNHISNHDDVSLMNDKDSLRSLRNHDSDKKPLSWHWNSRNCHVTHA